MTGSHDLDTTFLRLRPDASIELLPVDGSFWERIASGALGDFHREFLVCTHTSEADWPTWERHPGGDEVVCLLSGSVTFVLETPEGERRVELSEPGSFVLVPRGTWHTAKLAGPARMLFLTAGEGTEHRPVGG